MRLKLPLPDDPVAFLPDNTATDALNELRETPGAALADAARRAAGEIDGRKQQSRIRKMNRDDAMDEHLHRILVIGLYFAGFLVLLMLFSIAWNLAASTGYRFLTDEQETKLQGFLLSGAVGSAITFAGKRIAGEKDTPES